MEVEHKASKFTAIHCECVESMQIIQMQSFPDQCRTRQQKPVSWSRVPNLEPIFGESLYKWIRTNAVLLDVSNAAKNVDVGILNEETKIN